jgi:hypothetical protein
MGYQVKRGMIIVEFGGIKSNEILIKNYTEGREQSAFSNYVYSKNPITSSLV